MAPFDLPDPLALGPDPELPGLRTAGPHHVLIAGSGPAATEAALTLRALGGSRLPVTLLTPADRYWHRPVSVAEPFAAGRARSYDLGRLRDLGIQVVKGTLAGVDAATRRVRTDEGQLLDYHSLLVATGAEVHPWSAHAVTFAGRPGDVERVHGIVQDLEGGWSRRIAFVAPRGCGWTLPLYELALQMAERARALCLEAELTLFTYERTPLEAAGQAASEAVRS
jgi:sulfide:quinone oxidoreductase